MASGRAPAPLIADGCALREPARVLADPLDCPGGEACVARRVYRQLPAAAEPEI